MKILAGILLYTGVVMSANAAGTGKVKEERAPK